MFSGSDWVTENTILARSLTGEAQWDVYKLAHVPTARSGRLHFRIRENATEHTTIDQLRLVYVDHAHDLTAFPWRSGGVLFGRTERIHRATATDGTDVTALLDGRSSQGFAGMPGETLLIDRIDPQAASALHPGAHETTSDPDPFGGDFGQKYEPMALPVSGSPPTRTDAAVLEGSGVLVQSRDATGNWQTIRKIYPREHFAQSVVDSLDQGPVRLVFVGHHKLRNLVRIVPVALGDPQVLSVTAARHSRMGDVRDLIAGNRGTVLLSPGDTISVECEAPARAPSGTREFFLVARGVYSSQTPLSQKAASVSLPITYALAQARPNPFSATAQINFDVPLTSAVRLEILDIQGRRVRLLTQGYYGPGSHSAEWNARDDGGSRLRPGVYVCSFTAGGFKAARRVIVLP